MSQSSSLRPVGRHLDGRCRWPGRVHRLGDLLQSSGSRSGHDGDVLRFSIRLSLGLRRILVPQPRFSGTSESFYSLSPAESSEPLQFLLLGKGEEHYRILTPESRSESLQDSDDESFDSQSTDSVERIDYHRWSIECRMGVKTCTRAVCRFQRMMSKSMFLPINGHGPDSWQRCMKSIR